MYHCKRKYITYSYGDYIKKKTPYNPTHLYGLYVEKLTQSG